MGATLIPPGVPVTPAERQQAVMEQRRRATEASARARRGREALMRRMQALTAAGSHHMASELVADTPDVMAAMRVREMLHRVRRLGAVGSDRMMEAAGIAPLARFGELTVEQRAALAALLRMRSSRVSRIDAR